VIEYTARRDTRALPITNECGMTFFISLFNIKTEEYPLSRRNLLYNHANLEGYARDFIDYLDGPDLDGLIAKAGFVNLDVVSEVQVEAAERVSAALPSADSYERRFMETLIQKQNEFERLSTTFRFAPGSDDLDPKGIRDLDRLVRFLAERKPSELIVVGFSDDRGTFDANILVSEEIASSVLGQIKAAAAGGELDGIVMSSLGFGELSPVACNKTPRGRAVNRRVEIWIK
jgi:phosphate transport system substrate-binding protein